MGRGARLLALGSLLMSDAAVALPQLCPRVIDVGSLLMSDAAVALPQLCPRVIDSSEDGRRLVTCGHTLPCPYHGDPLFRVVGASEDSREEH
jgi:hypothetical protein